MKRILTLIAIMAFVAIPMFGTTSGWGAVPMDDGIMLYTSDSTNKNIRCGILVNDKSTLFVSFENPIHYDSFIVTQPDLISNTSWYLGTDKKIMLYLGDTTELLYKAMSSEEQRLSLIARDLYSDDYYSCLFDFSGFEEYLNALIATY